MRRDRRNTARSPLRARYRRGERPWTFRTGKGVFSTPVIGGDGTVYVGSADTYFYAVGRSGRLRWRFKTGEIIDSAATIGAYDRRLRTSPITVGSGDERIYRLRSDRRRLPRRARTIWTYSPSRGPGTGQLVNWWEGNAVTGFGGVIYAGNTGGGGYAINPDGSERWVFPTGNSVWSAPAMTRDGRTFWSSLDLGIYGVGPRGQRLWSFTTLGFNASSPALSRDESTLYVGSFDSNVHALDARTGQKRWSFTTADHVYSSPAITEHADGRTKAVYAASADGSVYALSPAGRLLWRYDTGDSIRSSPVLGRARRGRGHIVYVGSSDGSLYAIDAESGRRRWSFDATPGDRALRDRNDLNGSPALGTRGVYVGGEHGRLVYVPYDYCLHHADPRCDTRPGEAFSPNLARVFYATPGGNTRPARVRERLPVATIVNGRLVVRRHGKTVDASMMGGSDPRTLVSTRPHFDFTAALSGDAHFLHVAPTGFLRPNTTYRVRIRGDYAAGGRPLANTVVDQKRAGRFDTTIRFRTARAGSRLPLAVGRNRVSALNLRRLAVPLPPMLPSLNQIGFDFYDLIVGTIAKSKPDARGEGTILMWVVAAKRDRRGVPVADPNATLAFPVAGRFKRDALILSARDVNLTFTFGDVPLRLFEFRGQLGRDLVMRGPSLYGEAVCRDVPVYGSALPLTGLCNGDGILVTTGTYLTRAYDRRGTANARPAGLRVTGLELRRPAGGIDGAAIARFSVDPGQRYAAREHLTSVLLTDAASGAPVSVDYRKGTSALAGPDGALSEVRVSIPAGTRVPERVRAYVIADAFPLESRELR
jgi:outer membrane protein assembly factor BamB